jgi:flagellar hook-associated protein 1 FlgK
MLGLFGTLDLGARALATQRQGVEVAGHNLANASNPAYSRQRVSIRSTAEIIGQYGSVGTGAEVSGITQIRSQLLDSQIVSEGSVGGSLAAQQSALQYAQARLGQQVDRLSSGREGATAANGVGGGRQIASGLADLFNAFQAVSTNPTSLSERQIALSRAAELATQFNQLDSNLGAIDTQLNQSLGTDLRQANALLGDIAHLNGEISQIEGSGTGTANDLRDHRQAKLEELSRLVRFDSVEQPGGAVDISIGGVAFVAGESLSTTLESFDPGNGRPLIRAAGTAGPLGLTGGSLHGTLDARDGAILELREATRSIAANLISEVNTQHALGFGLNGTTGTPFFLGTTAGDIRVNPALAGNPALLQASGDAASPGNNRIALGLAQIGTKPLGALGGQTLSGRYSEGVADLGESLASVNRQLSDHDVVAGMLSSQRDSVSGVSVDEEMTSLTKFQRAYQASAKLITTIDEMLDITLGLKR